MKPPLSFALAVLCITAAHAGSVGHTYIPLSSAGATDTFLSRDLERELLNSDGLPAVQIPAAPALGGISAASALVGHNEIDAAMSKSGHGYSSTVLPSSSLGGAGGLAPRDEYKRFEGVLGKYTSLYEQRVRNAIGHSAGTPDNGPSGAAASTAMGDAFGKVQDFGQIPNFGVLPDMYANPASSK